MSEKQEVNFLDEILKEAEEKEEALSRDYADLILIEIRNLESEIESTFDQAEKERIIIKNWALNRNSKLQERIDFLAKKLEVFLKEEELKTLDLPNGKLKFRKQPDRVEITDLDVFLKRANQSMLTLVPASFKPDLNKIKKQITMSGKVPQGVREIKGEVKFSYLIKNHKETENGKTRSADKQTSAFRTAI